MLVTTQAMRKILVVEDETSLRKDIIEMLTYEGFEVIGAENGRIGIEQAQRHLPDLIICDIMMPEVNGYDVLAELRRDSKTATIPFIFLTARTDKMDRRQGMEQGADDYLTKPFAIQELLRTIEVRIERHQQFQLEAERRNTELRNNIILSMPHELRTPLTVILGFSDILIGDFEDMQRDRIQDMAVHINKAAVRLYHLVENYLVYAQIEIAANEPDFDQMLRANATIEPRIVVENQAIQKAQQYDREGDLVLEIADLEQVPMLEDYLRKMVEELIDNAFKFSSDGSKVTVTLNEDQERTLLTITDHGRGMNLEEVSDVGAYMQFNRKFYEQQGSGLGLTIARRVAELHGGRLSIASQEGEYTTVSVMLPQRRDPA
jgi:CheY-like chemotaxis protein